MNKLSWHVVEECDYCEGRDFTNYVTCENNFLRNGKKRWFENKLLELKQCVVCGLAVACPRPERNSLYADYLEGGELAQEAVARKLGRPNVVTVHERAVAHALKFSEGAKKLFDMGCGAGTVMEAAKKQGLVAEGNDINKSAIERLGCLGFDVYHGFTRELKLPKENYDIVINLDYLEHTYEPYEDLKICNRILKQRGILYLKTVYLDCPDHILKGDDYQLFGPHHFSYFPARTLCSMIYSAGFEIEDLRLGQLAFVTARKVCEPDSVPRNYYDISNAKNVASRFRLSSRD